VRHPAGVSDTRTVPVQRTCVRERAWTAQIDGALSGDVDSPSRKHSWSVAMRNASRAKSQHAAAAAAAASVCICVHDGVARSLARRFSGQKGNARGGGGRDGRVSGRARVDREMDLCNATQAAARNRRHLSRTLT